MVHFFDISLFFFLCLLSQLRQCLYNYSKTYVPHSEPAPTYLAVPQVNVQQNKRICFRLSALTSAQRVTNSQQATSGAVFVGSHNGR